MKYEVRYSSKALKDLYKLDNSQQARVIKAIKKVSANPVSIYEGGFGKPLGIANGINLKNCYKIKLKKDEIRVVYKLIKVDKKMFVIVIGARADDEVYIEAEKRIKASK